MPRIECLVTQNDSLLMVSAGDGRLTPLAAEVATGESPLEACGREVLKRTGFHVSPSCAGIVYSDEDPEHDYTLVFIADAPDGAPPRQDASLRWIDLAGFKQQTDALHRELVPLMLTADEPLAVLLDLPDAPGAGEPRIKESAPIPVARLSPLVFAIVE
jgi:ADP-ribose pyrophosphatase YjhB (NUDIX family)